MNLIKQNWIALARRSLGVAGSEQSSSQRREGGYSSMSSSRAHKVGLAIQKNKLSMKIKYTVLILNLVMVIAPSVFGIPKNVIIIRHADRVLPSGVCLSLQGLERAAALAYYFSGTSIYNTPPITHIFAAYSNKPPQPYIRCKQTCQPLAHHLKIPINTDFDQHHVTEVAKEILTNPKYDNATVLMCWEHMHIAPLVVAFGAKDPGFWPHHIFDQVYMLSFEENGKLKFQKFLQELLFGDRMGFQEEPHPLPQVPVPCPAPS